MNGDEDEVGGGVVKKSVIWDTVGRSMELVFVMTEMEPQTSLGEAQTW